MSADGEMPLAGDPVQSGVELLLNGLGKLNVEHRPACGADEVVVMSGEFFVEFKACPCFQGRRLPRDSSPLVATFDTPTGALSAASSIANGAHVLGVEVRCGLHVGEVEVRPDEDIAGIAVNIAAWLLDAGGARDVIATQTVVDLAWGSGFEFAERGAHELQGVSGVWDLYELKS